MAFQRLRQIHTVSRDLGISEETILRFIEEEWIIPAESRDPEMMELDEEDIARLRLICELKFELGIRNDRIAQILQLLDQGQTNFYEVTYG